MGATRESVLRAKLDPRRHEKIAALNNPPLDEFLARFVGHPDADTVFVGTDSPKDIAYFRRAAVEKGEEIPLKRKGHAIHFDGYYDQARDKDNTRIRLPKGTLLGDMIETRDRDEGLADVLDILKGIMKGKEQYVRFFRLGPLHSEFSIPCVQLTYSAYVAHNEDLLYRQGCERFKKIGASPDFLKFVRSAGELENAVYGVNVEKGIFGIIRGINRKDDKLLWDALHTEGEIIFSNVLLMEDGGVYWIDKDDNPPKRGINHGGEWYPEKRDAKGNLIDVSHKNARFALDMKLLANRDPEMENPEGVKISGIICGGRDSDTWVPVEESFEWEHGIVTKGASLESETTAATLGKEGVRQLNPISNLDFLSITIGRYVRDNLEFGKGVADPPRIFSVNYFLKDREGRWLNEREDKRVWLKWMELRVHGDIEALKTPTGRIPKYEDLRALFSRVLSKKYGREEYVAQFTLRLPENIRKTERILKLYRDVVLEFPPGVFEVLEEQKARLLDFQKTRGDYVSPFDL